jgi:hypothetical protein
MELSISWEADELCCSLNSFAFCETAMFSTVYTKTTNRIQY